MNIVSNLSNGRIVIPAAFRQQLDIQDGDQLIWSVRNGELVATTRRAQLAKAQALFQSFAPKGSPSVADELIAERRAAADSE
ncbi:MAG: AbrB family DNA-binding protein [Comamonadaceae bacterium]|nr:MAG: AbrB family DNA-binding protein [Comamonadaceae bacterium]